MPANPPRISRRRAETPHLHDFVIHSLESEPMHSHKFSLLAGFLLSFATLLPAQQDLGQQERQVLTHRGWESFTVSDWQAESSDAARLNLDMADKLGRIPEPTPGYRLLSQVLVETDDLGDLTALSEAFGGLDVRPVEGSPGFWLVDASSVASAVELSAALASAYPPGKVYLDLVSPRFTRQVPSDPNFNQQWHLRNTNPSYADVNAEPAWDAGYTGNGFTLGVVEWGVQTNHPDLQANYHSAASQSGGSSSHGTSVAGVMSAVANNGRGGVGAAYNSQFSKQYVSGSSGTANAFNYRNDLNDIKNNSWGPSDNGNLHFISSTELNALANSVDTGRGGLGEIFCWAAGNGGESDRVEYDPYASSRYTIAVGAIGDQDDRAWYNERGSSMLVVAHSSGNNRGIYTTDSGSSYTSGFGGTSSASPLGAGAIALMLEANPNLSWRDVQGVLVHSSRKNDPNDSFWTTNGAGHDISYRYGYGAVDAGKGCAVAAAWESLGSEQSYASGTQSVNQTIPDNDTTGLTETVTVNSNFKVEAVEVILNVNHTYIGDLQVKLTSPSGTNSVLTKTRDDSQNNFSNYRLTSLRHWDEDSQGNWTLQITDRSSGTTGTWNNWSLNLFGNDGSGGPGMTLSTGVLSAGFFNNFDVDFAQPNSMTYLVYSLQAGSTFISQLGVTVDMANPQLAAPGTLSGADGKANFTVSIPSTASGLTVRLQAIQSGNVSNLWNMYIN